MARRSLSACNRAGEGIFFINSLLVPVVLRFAELRGAELCRAAMEEIIKTGRGSRQVVPFAGEWPEKRA